MKGANAPGGGDVYNPEYAYWRRSLSGEPSAGGSRLVVVAGPARGQGSPRQQEKRQEKLAEIKRQVKDGSLVIRKMTAAEKKRNPAVPRKQRGGRRR
jgi:hypothetical protein